MTYCKKLLKLDLAKSWEGGKGHEIHTVSRGILCNRLQEQWEKIRKHSEEKEISEFRKFVGNLKDCDDFGGVLHRNSY